MHREDGGMEGGIGSGFRGFVGEFEAESGSCSIAASPEDVNGALLLCSVVQKVIVPVN